MSISKIIKTDCMHSSRFLTLNKHASCVQTSPSTVAMGKGKAMTLNQLEQGHETTLCKILVWSLHVFFSSNGTDRLKLHLLSAYGQRFCNDLESIFSIQGQCQITFCKKKNKNCQEHIFSSLDPDGLTPHPQSVCWLGQVGTFTNFWDQGSRSKICDGKSFFVLVIDNLQNYKINHEESQNTCMHGSECLVYTIFHLLALIS